MAERQRHREQQPRQSTAGLQCARRHGRLIEEAERRAPANEQRNDGGARRRTRVAGQRADARRRGADRRRLRRLVDAFVLANRQATERRESSRFDGQRRVGLMRTG